MWYFVYVIYCQSKSNVYSNSTASEKSSEIFGIYVFGLYVSSARVLKKEYLSLQYSSSTTAVVSYENLKINFENHENHENFRVA